MVKNTTKFRVQWDHIFCNRQRYSPFSNRYIFDVLSAKVNVFFN